MKQKGFFDGSCEDLPLFSGTPMQAHEEGGVKPVSPQQPTLPCKCRICRDTGRIEFNVYCTCEAGAKARDNQRIIRECAGITDGTLASLTGLHLYSEISKVQADWVIWLVKQFDSHFEHWQDAWQAWVEAEHPEWRER